MSDTTATNLELAEAAAKAAMPGTTTIEERLEAIEGLLLRIVEGLNVPPAQLRLGLDVDEEPAPKPKPLPVSPIRTLLSRFHDERQKHKPSSPAGYSDGENMRILAKVDEARPVLAALRAYNVRCSAAEGICRLWDHFVTTDEDPEAAAIAFAARHRNRSVKGRDLTAYREEAAA